MYFLLQIFNIVSSIVTIVDFIFFEDDNRKNFRFIGIKKTRLTLVLVLSIFISFGFVNYNHQAKLKKLENENEIALLTEQYEQKLADVKMKNIAKEAKSVSDAIDINRYADVGSGISNLTRIVGFYKYAEDRYPIEYQSYSEELTRWKEYQQRLLSGVESESVSLTTDLSELVISADKHLESIYEVYLADGKIE